MIDYNLISHSIGYFEINNFKPVVHLEIKIKKIVQLNKNSYI